MAVSKFLSTLERNSGGRVQEEILLAKLGALVNLQITNGCNDLKNITHQHHSHVTEMVEIISDCIKEKSFSITRESFCWCAPR